MEEQTKELRRIRIALVVLVIATLFTGGGQDVNMDFPFDNPVDVEAENVIQFVKGRFGVLKSGYLEIYEYDAEKNQVKKIKEGSLDEWNE